MLPISLMKVILIPSFEKILLSLFIEYYLYSMQKIEKFYQWTILTISPTA